MNSVKLAPFIGLTANTHVELESLSSLIGTYPSPDSQFQNRATYTSQIKSIPERPTIAIPETVDDVASKRATAYKRSYALKRRRNRRDQVSPLSITDVNNLWGVYLKQQNDLGVDTSDKQAMAKRYHELNENEVKILKNLSGKKESDDETPIEYPRKRRIKVVPETVKRADKPVNKRQKRKKMIRDELKRQLSIFIHFPESEGFPWKAIVSEKGYRDLKLEGWPGSIPVLKRIDDFNPSELNIFEDGINNRTIKIVKMKEADHYETEEETDDNSPICYLNNLY